jgi:hypothetical protein
MVGADAGVYVGVKIRTVQLRTMTVNGFVLCMGVPDFCHDLRVVVDHPGEIHHFPQKINIIPCHEGSNVSSVNDGSGGLKWRGWYA